MSVEFFSQSSVHCQYHSCICVIENTTTKNTLIFDVEAQKKEREKNITTYKKKEKVIEFCSLLESVLSTYRYVQTEQQEEKTKKKIICRRF